MDTFFILKVLWFFLPAYIANMAPPIAAKLGVFEFLNKPIDNGIQINGKSFLGSHKTWRGLLLGTAVGMCVYFLQTIFFRFEFFASISILDYQNINPWLFGFLLPFGALIGDMAFSFLKRQINIAPGESWMPFDQTDYVFGVMAFLGPYLNFEIRFWLWLILLTFVLHVLFNKIGFWLKINKAEW